MRYATSAGIHPSITGTGLTPELVRLAPKLARWFSTMASDSTRPPKGADARPAFIAPVPFQAVPKTPPPEAEKWRCNAEAPRDSDRAAERAASLLREARAAGAETASAEAEAMKDARIYFRAAFDAGVIEPLTSLVQAASEALEAPADDADASPDEASPEETEALALHAARLYSLVNPRLATVCRNAARTLSGMATDAFPLDEADLSDWRRMNNAAMVIDTIDRPMLLHCAIALVTGAGADSAMVADGVCACLTKKYADTFAMNAHHRLGAGLPHDERTLAADDVDRVGPQSFHTRGRKAAEREVAGVLVAAKTVAPQRARFTLRSVLKAAGPVGD